MIQVGSHVDVQDRVTLLSQRERNVLELLAEGLGVKEIAHVLRIAVRTVDTYIRNIFDKLGVNKAVLAVRYAIRSGLVPA